MNEDFAVGKGLDLSKARIYTIPEIQKALTGLPEAKYRYGVAVIQAKAKFDEAKYNLKRVMAAKQLEASSMKNELGLSSDTDRKSWVMNQPEVAKAEVELIEAEGELKTMELKYQRAEDEFVTARKLANMVQEDEENQQRYDRYRDPNA